MSDSIPEPILDAVDWAADTPMAIVRHWWAVLFPDRALSVSLRECIDYVVAEHGMTTRQAKSLTLYQLAEILKSSAIGRSKTLNPTQESYVFATALWLAYKRAEQPKVVAGERKRLKQLEAYPLAVALGWNGDKRTFKSHVHTGMKTPRWRQLAEAKSREVKIPATFSGGV